MNKYSYSKHSKILLVFILAVSENVNLFAQEPQLIVNYGELVAGQQALAEQYIAAVTEKNVEKVKALYHPQAFDCIAPSNQEYNSIEDHLKQHISITYDGEITISSVVYKEMKDLVEETVTATSNEAMERYNFQLNNALTDSWSFSVDPTHQLFILDEKDIDGMGKMLLPVTKLPIVEEGNQWWLTFGCLNEKGDELREIIRSISSKTQKADQLYEQLTEADLERIKQIMTTDNQPKEAKEKLTHFLQETTGETDPMTLDMLTVNIVNELLPTIIQEQMANTKEEMSKTTNQENK